MKLDAKGLMELVPGSTAYMRGQQLVWEPPKGGHMLDGKQQRGDGSQAERQENIFTVERAFWFKGSRRSPWLFQNNKDGIKFREPGWRMTSCHFREPGEDCVTAMAGSGRIEDCLFIGKRGSDKCLQLNVADDVIVDQCKFHRFTTAIQCGLSIYSKTYHRAEIRKCEFDDIETAIRAVKAQVHVSQCKYMDGVCLRIAEKGGKIIE